MCLQQNSRDEAYAQVQIKLNYRSGIHNLSAKIDTGAQGNTIPLRTFRRMYPDKLDAEGFPVEHIVAAARYPRLTAYNGTSIACHGIANIPCSYSNSAWDDTQFYIVDVTGLAVIGLQSCEKLKLVTLHCTIKAHSSAEEPAQQQETLLPHEIPSRPLEVVGTDMFFFNDADWLIIADYYSKFPIVRKMPRPCLSTSVVSVTKHIFSETGVPSLVVSDNGPHFASACYADLSKKMSFRHVTSSPKYPRSNGFVERQIQTVKHVMKKARQSGQDLDFALLCLRTTSIDSKLPSPAELLNGRKAKSTLLTKIVDTRQYHDEIRERLQERQNKMTYQHDQHARDLPPLHNGQAVRFCDQDGRWKPATVLNKTPNPRSYILATPSTSTIRRNRNHIRDNSTQPVVKRVSFGSPTAVQPAFGSPTAVQPAFGSPTVGQPASAARLLSSPLSAARLLSSPLHLLCTRRIPWRRQASPIELL